MIWPRRRCVVAGLDVALEAFRQLDPERRRSRVHQDDGDRCEPGDVDRRDATASRPALLTAERTALNFLQRLSRHRHADAPVRRRGGRPHHRPRHAQDDADAARAGEVRRARRRRHQPSRSGWTTAILIKDNHVRLAGGRRTGAWQRMREASTRDADRGRGAEPRAGRRGAGGRRGHHPARQPVIARRSRGSREARARPREDRRSPAASRSSRMPELAATGADFVSVGALTHSAPADGPQLRDRAGLAAARAGRAGGAIEFSRRTRSS